MKKQNTPRAKKKNVSSPLYLHLLDPQFSYQYRVKDLCIFAPAQQTSPSPAGMMMKKNEKSISDRKISVHLSDNLPSPPPTDFPSSPAPFVHIIHISPLSSSHRTNSLKIIGLSRVGLSRKLVAHVAVLRVLYVAGGV